MTKEINPALLISGGSYSKKNLQTKNIRGWERKVTYGYKKEELEKEESYDYRDARDREK